jgi:putative RNA 2'-phosphotransferase
MVALAGGDAFKNRPCVAAVVGEWAAPALHRRTGTHQASRNRGDTKAAMGGTADPIYGGSIPSLPSAMLAQCRTHGYYRGEQCPLCDETGRFLMKDFEIDRVGRMMAGILRHFPERFNLTMDGRGWVDLEEFTNAIKDSRDNYRRWLRREHIEALVETDEKGRYQIDGGMVRATYAHSVNVNLDDLPEANVDKLYFPVAEEELDVVLEAGLRPSDRNMIHLSATPDKAYSAGRVHIPDPILLEVDVKGASDAGNFIFRAGKAVYVTDAVEPNVLSKFEDEEAMAKLRKEFGTGASDAEKKAAEAAKAAESTGKDDDEDTEAPEE